jgi:hypothetical protein
MTELLVIPSELERAAGRLQASADQVRSVVGTLLPTVGGLGAAFGDAALADRFQTLWSRWASELACSPTTSPAPPAASRPRPPSTAPPTAPPFPRPGSTRGRAAAVTSGCRSCHGKDASTRTAGA